MKFSGRVWKYGDDINTDLIYPGRYTYLPLSEEEMASHALEDLDSLFKDTDTIGDFLVVGKNFGCGSAREQAVKSIKHKGIRAIIGHSFSRIFYRNSINEGLLTIVCPKAVNAVSNGDRIFIDYDKGLIMTEQGEFHFETYSEFVLEIIEDGGLINNVRKLIKYD